MSIIVKHIRPSRIRKMHPSVGMGNNSYSYDEFATEEAAAEFISKLHLPTWVKDVYRVDKELAEKLKRSASDNKEDKDYQEWLRLQAKFGKDAVHIRRGENNDDNVSGS